MTSSKWLFSLSILSILLLSSCATTSNYQTQQAETPGMHNLWSWYGQSIFYANNSAIGTTPGVDIDGKVGYPLTVSSPTANCVFANGQQNSSWSMSPTVSSGSLPPGMVLNSAPATISGIPTERGHWIVTLSSGDLYCEGKSYNGFTQEIRFHITGSGQVVQ